MTDLLSHALLADTANGLSLLLESLRSGGSVMMLIVLCSFAAVTVSTVTWLRTNHRLSANTAADAARIAAFRRA